MTGNGGDAITLLEVVNLYEITIIVEERVSKRRVMASPDRKSVV